MIHKLRHPNKKAVVSNVITVYSTNFMRSKPASAALTASPETIGLAHLNPLCSSVKIWGIIGGFMLTIITAGNINLKICFCIL